MTNVETKSSCPMFTEHDYLKPKSAYRVQPFGFGTGVWGNMELNVRLKKWLIKG